jgi:hypothetical protein
MKREGVPVSLDAGSLVGFADISSRQPRRKGVSQFNIGVGVHSMLSGNREIVLRLSAAFRLLPSHVRGVR